MAVEKEATYDKTSPLARQMAHLKKAEDYAVRSAEAARSCKTIGTEAQVRLEQSILRGLRSRLEYREGAHPARVAKLNKEAVGGIEKALEELKGMDARRYQDNLGNAEYWLKILLEDREKHPEYH